jgi:putative cardiolipin synthase
LVLRFLSPLPAIELRRHSNAISGSNEGPLARGARQLAADHPGLSGIHMLNDGRSGFAARMTLARSAVHTLDVQYYIWKGDLSGSLLLNELRAAAARGVRVRLLLDDNGISGLDEPLAALDQAPNIEVRIYNPFTIRKPKLLGYLADFSRLNRRMHNKSFTADGVATVIGGRNVGDEYFGARDGGLFADLDLLTIGPAAADVERQFDTYWNSASAYPAERILPQVAPERIATIDSAAEAAARDPRSQAYLQAVVQLPIVEQLKSATLALEWASVTMVSDDPCKTLGRAEKSQTLWSKLTEALGMPQHSLDLVSGYFVPTAAGVAALTTLAREGKDVRVLTNAFETTDVGIVHSGYAGRRKALLKAGVKLFEMRAPATSNAMPHTRMLGSGSGSGGSTGSGPVLRLSASMLHAKTFAVDGQRIFVGSFNFDPRSMHLNTELGFLIDSPALANHMNRAFAEQIPARSYQVMLTPAGALQWVEHEGARIVCHDVEPGTTWYTRATTWLLSHLPIEWLL